MTVKIVHHSVSKHSSWLGGRGVKRNRVKYSIQWVNNTWACPGRLCHLSSYMGCKPGWTVLILTSASILLGHALFLVLCAWAHWHMWFSALKGVLILFSDTKDSAVDEGPLTCCDWFYVCFIEKCYSTAVTRHLVAARVDILSKCFALPLNSYGHPCFITSRTRGIGSVTIIIFDQHFSLGMYSYYMMKST